MFGMHIAETPYDLRFEFLRIPVRVHPMFWLAGVLLGANRTGVMPLLIWVACVFVSIIVHEFGHGLMARACGFPASIVLYWMGGLCYSDSERQGPWQRLAVLICGPGAGFVLAGLVYGTYLIAGEPELSRAARIAIGDLLFINICWGVINLLPLMPLDGGQITGVVLTMFNRRKGMRWGYTISLVTGGLLAVVALVKFHEPFLGILFAVLAFNSYQTLQAEYQQSRYGADDPADWWKH